MMSERRHLSVTRPDQDTPETDSGVAVAGSEHEAGPVREPELDPISGAALRLWVILSRAHSAIQAHASADVARHGLTLAEFAILEALYHRGPMLLGEVQRRILVSSGGITFLVDRLTGKGLVERRTCHSDRRARYAALTDRGEALVAEIFPAHAEAVTRAMTALTPDQQHEIADALRSLGTEAASMSLPENPTAKGRREG